MGAAFRNACLGNGDFGGLAHFQLPALNWAAGGVELAGEIIEPLGVGALGRAEAVLEEEPDASRR
jgi:hypothetical protein